MWIWNLKNCTPAHCYDMKRLRSEWWPKTELNTNALTYTHTFIENIYQHLRIGVRREGRLKQNGIFMHFRDLSYSIIFDCFAEKVRGE